VPAEAWGNYKEDRVFRRVEGDPGTSVRRIAAAGNISVPLFWRILHEQSLYPTTSSECKPSLLLTIVQGRGFGNGFSQNTRFIVNMFTYEEGFTIDGIVNFHNTHARVDDSPHTIATLRYIHRISEWVF
jgi:hypothetical protein